MSFLDNIFKKDAHEIVGLNNELKSIYIYNKFKTKNKSILLVTSNLHEAEQLYSSLTHHTDKVWLFPMDDFITSVAVASSPELKVTRLETLNNIINEDKVIVITNLMGYLRYLPSKDLFKESHITLKKEEVYNIDSIVEKLFSLGYKREVTVNMTGEIATRGFVLDIFPINCDNPVRIEFWGDEIDSIKSFNVDTQMTTDKLEQVTINPNTETLFKNHKFGASHDELKDEKGTVNIAGYLNNPQVIFNNYQALYANYALLVDEITNYNKGIEKNIKYMFNLDELLPSDLIVFEELDELSLNIKDRLIYKKVNVEFFPKESKEINKRLNEYLKLRKTVIICLSTRYQVNHLIEFLGNDKVTYTNEDKIFSDRINVIVKNLNDGFQTEEYVVITESELYGKKSESNYKTKFKYGTRIKDITKLNIGDFVVHGSYGIGRYTGLKTIVKNGLKKDYLTIVYRDEDKLYIPVEKIDLITKYSSGDGMQPKLSKLGSADWQKTKARARKHAEDIAEDLLKVYAIRESKKGFAFDKDGKEQIEFEKEFKYTETADQLRVTEEIKKEMESDKPMDRLLCGDVGYGKTEVAFRAIFKAIISGKQAAILCPTTILSNQHYKNALERFKNFPVDIALLNRFVSKKDIGETLDKLKKGQIDLLIGTHRILSDDVEFKNLGLLVIDEEQRFGVKHKEKIKKYKNNIDVLTLSATPIPRTLQMSMAGIRSLSLIETPPKDRYPIQTYVLPENAQIIKDAVLKELARGGQTFILYNNVQNIESKKIELERLIPTAKIGVAHGQMTKDKLEMVMLDFIDKKYDVLLCTTIIETGIDIESANTLIIIDADHFGLSQLYQIRGRIGRSNKIAYCFLMYDNKKILSEIATKRLKVIKDFTELGSGFAIAMRDLSIRGAGDLLGSEQAGFIDSIGVELFMQMVNEEINRLQGKDIIPEDTNNKLPLIDVETSIDDNYVSDEELKIEIHKKIASISSYESLKNVKNELEDRFGKLSDDLIIYMHEELFEKMADKLNIRKIKQTKNSVEIMLDKLLTNSLDGEKLFYEVSMLSRMFRFSMNFNNLTITLDTVKLDKHFIYYLLDLLKIIDKCRKKEIK
ncbi:MAG: transcription-repair coupling factor [Bacilli bacterium]|nr:transcription-repair coupling factor [Bacilli bacterium]